MSKVFSELVKNFDKTRDYIRDFYIYGFKTRNDFQHKSLRTYDNERRRIESWLGSYIKFSNSAKGKQISISCDSGTIYENPLYNAYRCKSFTDNDIQLHFFLLDILEENSKLSVDNITDLILEKYGVFFEPQTVRLKLKEYTNEGIFTAEKSGRSLVYSKSGNMFEQVCGKHTDSMINAIKFFSESVPFGVVGNYILKSLNKINDTFLIKHNFIVHTLEDNILLSLISAIEEKRCVDIVNYGKSHKEMLIVGIPLRIHVSTQTGRRYVILYESVWKRFISLRLDYIKKVSLKDVCENYDLYLEKYFNNVNKCWGTSFGNERSKEGTDFIEMTVYADEENEKFIIDRLKREGRSGDVSRIAKNTFLYKGIFFDASEIMTWIKTFTGRILSLESNNINVTTRFYSDIQRMKKMYEEEE